MAQIFPPSSNGIARLMLIAVLVLVASSGFIAYQLGSTSYVTRAFEARQQPIQFSHERHVAGNGLDCRFCHTAAESSATAGIPPTKTCMGCHSQIWASSPYLDLVRSGYATDTSIQWVKVHDLPDFVYFNHSIHLNKGVGCTTCHGRVDQMPLIWTVQSLQMEWCLDCHRAPEKYLRPREAVFSVSYQAPANQLELGRTLLAQYNVRKLTNCSTCHR
jgi:hypothetical protein